MSPTRQVIPTAIMTAKTTTGNGATFDCGSFKQVIIQVATASSANMTIKINGSLGTSDGSAPTFSSAASATNPHTTISFVNLTSGSVVAGGTGIAFTGTDGVVLMQVNTPGLRYLTCEITAVSAGSATVTAVGFSNL